MTKQDRTAWMLAGALFLALFFIWGVAYDCFPILLPSVLKQFHLTREQIGKVPAAQALAALIVSPMVGWLLDRIPAQIVMSAGAVLTAIGIVLMARAGSFHGVLAGAVVTGVGLTASTILPSTMVISNWFGERRGTALGITTAGMELGGMVIAMTAGHLDAIYGWRFAYAVLAIPLVVIVVPLHLIFVRTRPEQAAPSASLGESSVAEESSGLPGLELDEALRTRAFWMLVVVQFCFTFAVGGSFIHLVQYLIGIGYTLRAGTMVVGFSLGLALIGKPTMGRAGRPDRRQERAGSLSAARRRKYRLPPACADVLGPGDIYRRQWAHGRGTDRAGSAGPSRDAGAQTLWIDCRTSRDNVHPGRDDGPSDSRKG